MGAGQRQAHGLSGGIRSSLGETGRIGAIEENHQLAAMPMPDGADRMLANMAGISILRSNKDCQKACLPPWFNDRGSPFGCCAVLAAENMARMSLLFLCFFLFGFVVFFVCCCCGVLLFAVCF